MKTGRLIIGALLALLAIVAVAAVLVVSSYNALVTLDQDARSRWAQVENVYQRRADVVPNLVSTVKAAAGFERETLTRVVEARSAVSRVTAGAANAPADAAKLREFERAQGELSSALNRLLVVAEQYPELRATQNFRDLQAQLEGTENRIAVERARYNEAARQFNTKRQSFPTSVVVGVFGERFTEKSYFAAGAGAQAVPSAGF